MRALIPFCLCCSLSSQAQDLPARIQSTLDGIVRECGIPGASLAVRLPDGQMLRAASGFADRERAEPMSPGHCMFSGSIGKTYVAAVALKLVAEGRLGLDDPVRNHLGAEPWFDRLPNGSRITVRQLLQHSTGLAEYVESEDLWRRVAAEPDKVWLPSERLAYVLGRPALFEPGKGFAYADTNFILLGMLLERVTGRRFEDLAKSMFIGPLGLNDTILANRRDLPHLPAGYSALPPMFRTPSKVASQGRYCFNPQLEWTGGGFCSTATDLARWGALLFGDKVLPAALRNAMVQSSGLPTHLGNDTAYGLATMIWNTPSGPLWGHSGFTPGFNALLQHDPSRGITLALLCNSDTALKGAGRTPHAVAQRLWKVLTAPSPHHPVR